LTALLSAAACADSCAGAASLLLCFDCGVRERLGGFVPDPARTMVTFSQTLGLARPASVRVTGIPVAIRVRPFAQAGSWPSCQVEAPQVALR